MADHRIYALLRERLLEGPAATATVIRTKGSTPREVGAKMIVQGERAWGTIGGGCGESEVVVVAREMLGGNGPTRRQVRIDLTERALETSDRICGGIMDVLVEIWGGGESGDAPPDTGTDIVRVVPLNAGPVTLWTPDSPSSLPLSETCREVWRARRSRVAPATPAPTAASTPTATPAPPAAPTAAVPGGSGGSPGSTAPPAEFASTAPVTEEAVAEDCFFELLTSSRTLVICGAGHIAQPLCSMGRLLDHRIVIIDDRPEYASVDRFTDADEVIALPFAEAIRGIEINGETLAILVTRGHRHDELCLRELLRTDVAYIGMLGSRRRVKAIFDDLHAEGYEPEQLSRVWAPVGLDIGAASPAEIAISILAEVVAWENGSTGPHPHLRRGPAGR